MNPDLQQILSACDNLYAYIRKSGERSSAVLVRAQAQKILNHAQEYAQAVADLGALGVPFDPRPHTKRSQLQMSLDDQFTLSLS